MGWFKRMFGDVDQVELVVVQPKPEPVKRAPRRDFTKLYPTDAEVFLKVTTNPKRQGTLARTLYSKYEYCPTVGECLANGITYRMLDSDVERGYIEVGDGPE